MILHRIAAAAFIAALPAVASAQMIVENAYLRAAGPTSPTAAAFMEVINHSDTDDRIVSASSPAAARVELHTHEQTADGVMRMIHVEEGFPVAAGETIALERGGRHVMFMGLTGALEDGDEVELSLTFEHAEPVTIMVPVDNAREDAGHGSHGG